MRKSSVLFSLALIASATASLWLWSELRAERARNAELITGIEALDASTTFRPTAKASQETLARASTELTSANTSSTVVAEVAAKDGPIPVMGTQEQWDAYERRMLRNPEYREARRQERRLQLLARRDDAIRLLGFSSAEADALIDRWVESELRWKEIERPSADTEEGARLRKEQADATRRSEEADLRALVGDQKYSRWQDYLESMPSRNRVNQLRSRLSGPELLRDEQVEPLIAALHTESSQFKQEMSELRESLSSDGSWSADSQRKFEDRQIERMTAANERAHSSAASILSHEQLAQLDALLRQELESRENDARMSRIQRSIGRDAQVTKSN